MKLFKLDRDIYASVCLCMLISMISIATSLNGIVRGIIGPGFLLGTMIVYPIYYFCLIMTFVSNKFSIKYSVLAILIFFVVVTMISLWFNPNMAVFVYGTLEQSTVEKPMYIFFIHTFSGLVVTTYIKNYNILYKYLEYFSYATVILAFIQYFFIKDESISGTYMTFSYNILLQSVFITLLCVKKFKITRLLCSIMGFLLIFIAGCRGALVSYLLCVLIYMLLYSFNSFYKKAIVFIVMCSLIFFVYVYFEEIIDFVNKQLINMDITSRTLIKLTELDFQNDSGRSIIQDMLIENYNLFGHGFFADRVFTGHYAHNIVVELNYVFGTVGGTMLFVVLCITIIRAWFCSKENTRILLITFLSVGFIKLMFSSSFLNREPCFYALLGLCINFIKNRKSNNQLTASEVRKC